jgi:hypothetical protein
MAERVNIGPDEAVEPGPDGAQGTTGGNTPAAPAAPAGGDEPILGGRFKTTEELIAAFTELESKSAPAPVPNPDEQTPAPNPADAERQAAEAKGVDFDGLQAEYDANGTLSDETYAKLEAAGFPKARVDAYIAGQAALADQIRGRIAASVGGDQALSALLEWAGANASPSEADAYHAALDSGNEQLIQQALAGFNTRYRQAMGNLAPALGGGNVPQNTGVKPFASVDELTRAMDDPRYRSGDRAYHAEIDKRLAVSPMFGYA